MPSGGGFQGIDSFAGKFIDFYQGAGGLAASIIIFVIGGAGLATTVISRKSCLNSRYYLGKEKVPLEGSLLFLFTKPIIVTNCYFKK
ncbi:hypothetical protein Q5O89_05365 [Peribacillus frigoritolerans]|nr:hypothetical protein [Peribacillus frigoritolerans]